jgi:hypothetical protein
MTQTEAMLELIRRAPATNDPARQSRASLSASELGQLKALMKQTKHSYPAQEIPEETVEMWAPAWIALAEKYGVAALQRAPQAHMMASRFLPPPVRATRADRAPDARAG